MKTQTYHLRALRAVRANRASHAAASAGMLMLGLEGLGGEHGMVRPLLEILAGGLLLAVVIYESIQDKRGTHHDTGYEIADFFAAFVAVVEGIVRIHHDNFWGSHLSQVWWLVALMFVSKGIYGSRLRFFNSFSLTETQFVFRKPFRQRVIVQWSQLNGFEITAGVLVFDRTGLDAVRIDLNLFERPDKIADWCRTEIPKYWTKVNTRKR